MPGRNETRVAVFLGGRSPEHDVSVITGLQALKAIDQDRFVAFPVYVTPRGEWLVGESLSERRSYLPDARTRGELAEVTLSLGEPGRGVLVPKRSGLFSRRPPFEFDAAVLAFHGLGGEDGQFQGLFETANLPYTGMRTLASAVFMDKAATKRLLRGLDIPLLPYAVVSRMAGGLPSEDALRRLLDGIGLPCIVKPVHLGSSIGVGKADTVEEVRALLPTIFRLDNQALLEPFVPNLVEYNLAVTRVGGAVRTSAIECPKRAEELLDFRQKYLSGGSDKGGIKGETGDSQGMLSLTREINPALPAELEANLRRWAVATFEAVDGTGAPRIDFYCNATTGEVWLNEVNPCPGSFGYFLWEAADPPVRFTALLSLLIDEARARHRESQLPDDPVPPEARLLRRPS
ncbi:MAG: D-alanine--D-alanine ligase [Alphaproteobacteria bacterium 13_1_20CM_3_64_12]|nr:MAG: D-alanine--D-alanine ligase [Alphaproteobacteria bacterium 13_1_20CM_3_64_12]